MARFYANTKKAVRQDRDIVLHVARSRGAELADNVLSETAIEKYGLDRSVIEAFRNDPEIILTALQGGSRSALRFASKTLRANREFVRKAVSVRGVALIGASKTLRSDEEIVREAVTQDGAALEIVPEDYRASCDNLDLLYLALQAPLPSLELLQNGTKIDSPYSKFNPGYAFQFAGPEVRANNYVEE